MNYDIDTKEGMKNSVDWTQRLFDTIREGGIWMIPRSFTLVTVYKSKKEVHIKAGERPERGMVDVIRAMGWTIVKI